MAGVKNSKVTDTQRSKSRAASHEGLDLDRQRPRGDLGHRLRIAREEKNIGLRELARRLGGALQSDLADRDRRKT